MLKIKGGVILHVIVIGGGPAGMMAAGQAAAAGASVLLLERNDRLGKKLAITGKGRGNVTNAADIGDFIQQFPGNGSFLYTAFYRFTNEDVRNFFLAEGVPTVLERGGRVFPESQRAADLVAAMESFLRRQKVRVQFGRRVTAILTSGNQVCGISCGEEQLQADAVVLATGGASYPATGSSGDGYLLAKTQGHTVITPHPALVPLETAEAWSRELVGLSLKNVTARVKVNGKLIAEEFGEMLFTHYGLSGPIILTLSRVVVQALEQKQQPLILLNLKPALTPEQLDARLLRDFEKYARKQFKNSLLDLLPQRLIAPVMLLSGIPPELPVHQVSKIQRTALLEVLTCLPLTVTGKRPLREAIVTAGGVSVKEVNPATMESKLIKGLYFAGELLDVDGNTGGYNLQAAFSTGFLAGSSAASKE
ncbi:MAG: NAD(P)/FAD-dependent oxidoreductase [Dethiobacter sp.]|jgi:predicted Rossmann fold flavoprotein|nr:NAD(P)/FAD-dependent oxidoreductase [Dethiobacter sp.]MBS3902328.1 NAD(P)/FAD-dependent oxidoreductase [Dethiobacter sp.]MBS3989381.1 NAD(P)/FAD-dependent oxidoreductase [Dethiobacter sp.]